MLTSTISELTGDGYVVVGTISARDGRLVIAPDNDQLLMSIAEDTLLDDAGEAIEPADAERFVENLWRSYNGSYLRASKPQEAA